MADVIFMEKMFYPVGTCNGSDNEHIEPINYVDQSSTLSWVVVTYVTNKKRAKSTWYAFCHKLREQSLFLSENSIQNHSTHFAFQALLGSGYAGLTGNLLFCGCYADRSFE